MKIDDTVMNEEMLLMEEVKEQNSGTDADEEIELSEDEEEIKNKESGVNEVEDDYMQRRLILMNLKTMIVSASAEAKEQVKPAEQQDEVPSITTVPSEEKSVQCTLCYSSLSCLSNVRRHERRYHKDHLHLLKQNFSEKDYVHQCDFCEVKLLTENLYGVHFITNHFKE